MLDDEGIGDSLLHSIETGFGAQLTSYSMGTGPPSPTLSGQGLKLTTYFHLMLWLNMCEVMSSLPHTSSRCAA
jgi:hypothetical protein